MILKEGERKMINLAICDDSAADIEKLERLLEDLTNKAIEYDVFFGGEELLEYKKQHEMNYQLYILDIEMSNMNGLNIAKKIRETDMKALIVFLTSFSSYVYYVFDVVTFDFIQKPITYKKLNHVLNKAINYLQITRRNFVFNYKRHQCCLNCDDILYFEKKGRQAYIYTINKEYVCNMTVEKIWEQLDTHIFAHIHNSFIVNLEYIKAIRRDELYLKNGNMLYISRNHKQELKEKHLLYIREKL
jgi:DNA-binding LytR/AlgR family response regulator